MVESSAFRAYASVRHRAASQGGPRALIFGHQKSGTSVVAAVIGQIAEEECSIDMPLERLRPTEPTTTSVDTLLRRSAPYSYRAIVKEPHWTLFAPELTAALPNVRAVGVTRDAVRTIEAICYRLRVTSTEMERLPEVDSWWQPIINGFGLETPSTSGLKNLAMRIKLCEQRMEQAAALAPGRWQIIRYEDFVTDPAAAAVELATFLGFEATGTANTDKQYQPGLRSLPPEERKFYQLSEVQRAEVSAISDAPRPDLDDCL